MTKVKPSQADVRRAMAKRTAARGLRRQRDARDTAVARQVAAMTTEVSSGEVVAVEAEGGHLTVLWRGADVQIDRLAHYSGAVGDKVAVAVTGSDLLVLGKRVDWPDDSEEI